MTTQKQCLWDTAGTCTYELTGVMTAYMKPVQARSRANLNMERDLCLRSRPGSRKLSAAGKGRVSFLQECSPDEFIMLQWEAIYPRVFV